jgi:hypothetical protein
MVALIDNHHNSHKGNLSIEFNYIE